LDRFFEGFDKVGPSENAAVDGVCSAEHPEQQRLELIHRSTGLDMHCEVSSVTAVRRVSVTEVICSMKGTPRQARQNSAAIVQLLV